MKLKEEGRRGGGKKEEEGGGGGRRRKRREKGGGGGGRREEGYTHTNVVFTLQSVANEVQNCKCTRFLQYESTVGFTNDILTAKLRPAFLHLQFMHWEILSLGMRQDALT